MCDINELQRDGLLEVFNIGVGRAASSLSLIVGDEVLLSAPALRLCTPKEAAQALASRSLSRCSMVSQHFIGHFDAQAMLIFPETQALEIVALMMGGSNLSAEELSEYEQEAMCEIGNIILNSSMSALADMFAVPFESTLPQHRFGNSSLALKQGVGATPLVLLLQVDLTISQKSIHGQIVLLLSVSSLARLMELVDTYMARMGLV